MRERGRRKEIACGDVTDSLVEPPPERDPEHDCLGHCLDRLPVSKRDLILDYYLYEGHRKIEHHKQMAVELNLSKGAIRNRAFQIKLTLEDCMRQCPRLREGRGCPWQLSHTQQRWTTSRALRLDQQGSQRDVSERQDDAKD